MIEDSKNIEVTMDMLKASEFKSSYVGHINVGVAIYDAIQASTQIQDLIAENKRLREANEWQPIETAPKDCELLGWYYSEGSTNYMIIRWFNDRWISIGINDIEECPQQPTHWRPLPQPPKELT